MLFLLYAAFNMLRIYCEEVVHPPEFHPCPLGHLPAQPEVVDPEIGGKGERPIGLFQQGQDGLQGAPVRPARKEVGELATKKDRKLKKMYFLIVLYVRQKLAVFLLKKLFFKKSFLQK